ncbi:unnamed protein product [Rhizophagus irregularis]|nr:unnamed protein product [Rhizophagus irregularis]
MAHSLLLQLPGRQNLLIVGAYIPPASSGLNNKLIAECHSTLISWITSARATGNHIILLLYPIPLEKIFKTGGTTQAIQTI